ncbi:sulfatase family protein [Saccharobesus litoralis]|nr:sulfatase [Saccharobesus litoralis]
MTIFKPCLGLYLILTSILSVIPLMAHAANNQKPNFVWLISEDNSKHYLNLYHPQGAKMPNVEKLAEQGLIFENAFSNAPVCSTARTTLATGAYASRIGTAYHRAYQQVPLPKGLKPVSQLLRDSGYYTTNRAKEDYNFINSDQFWDQSNGKAHWRNRKSKQQPFFHVQTFTITHEYNLHFPANDVIEKTTQHDPNNIVLPPIYPNTETFRYTYARTLDNHVKADQQIGQVIQQLEQDGELENTFVFYFGDHGGVLPGSKGYLFERGLNVPLVVRIPKNYRHLIAADLNKPNNLRLDGFVSFVDFAPTLLALANLNTHEQHDGSAFLGKNIDKKALNSRNSTLSYADRFDEKSDRVRSLRIGDLKYIRNYHAYMPDGLFANYRYKQVAFKQWREHYENGLLNKVQASFFTAKPVEALYDIKNDPYETVNLAKQPEYAAIVKDMRNSLTARLKSLPDLGFYPESLLHIDAFDNPTAFGLRRQANISQLIDIANLQLEPFSMVKNQLNKLLDANDDMQRYWAIVTLTTFGQQAKSFSTRIESLLKNDPNVLVKARAVEFLTLVNNYNPVSKIESLLKQKQHELVDLEILNIATLLRDLKGYSFNIQSKPEWQTHTHPNQNTSNRKNINYWLQVRLEYLNN